MYQRKRLRWYMGKYEESRNLGSRKNWKRKELILLRIRVRNSVYLTTFSIDTQEGKPQGERRDRSAYHKAREPY